MALILAVDDSLDDLVLLQEFLLTLGFNCRLASSGKMAMDLFEREKFDLVISDYQMPDGDGIWLLNQVKQNSQDTRFILTTAELSLEEKHFHQHRPCGLFYKPLDLSKLKTEILRLLGY